MWKDIKDYEGLYQINEYGVIRSLDRVVIDKNGREIKFKGKIIKQRPTTTSDYLVCDLSKNGKRKHYCVHRLVAIAFVSGWFENAVVDHIDGNIYNNHFTNLRWITQKENIHHGYKNSGINQVRNYRPCILYENGVFIGEFQSTIELCKYAELNYGASFTSLRKYKKWKELYWCYLN